MLEKLLTHFSYIKKFFVSVLYKEFFHTRKMHVTSVTVIKNVINVENTRFYGYKTKCNHLRKKCNNIKKL